jgi:hypothetical protein
MDVRAQKRDTTLRRVAWPSRTTTTNQRPAIYKVATGNQLKGATVEILGTPKNKPLEALRPTDKLWVREYTQFFRPEQTLREATIGWRNLERTYRTPQERELGHDFTEDEAAEYERAATIQREQARQGLLFSVRLESESLPDR